MNRSVCIDIEKTEAEELADIHYLRHSKEHCAPNRKPDYNNDDRHGMYH